MDDSPISGLQWPRFRSDEVHEEPAVTLDAFIGQSNANAVRIEPSDDVPSLVACTSTLLDLEN